MVNKSKNMEVNDMIKPNIINGLDLTFSSSELFLEYPTEFNSRDILNINSF